MGGHCIIHRSDSNLTRPSSRPYAYVAALPFLLSYLNIPQETNITPGPKFCTEYGVMRFELLSGSRPEPSFHHFVK